MSPQALLRLVAQLTFGWDTVTGLGAYVSLSFLFQEQVNIWFLVWAGLAAYLPDLDLIYFVFLPKNVRKWGHWRLGFHHPMFFLPATGIIAWYVSGWLFPTHEVFLTVLTVVCVFGHFVHDSTIVGLHWFSPFTRNGGLSLSPLDWLSIKLTWRGPRIVSRDEVKKQYSELAHASLGGNAVDEITTRIETVTMAQIICFSICVIGLAMLTLVSGYQISI